MDGLPFGWLRTGGNAQITGLKARPALNGEAVVIEGKDPVTGRWRVKIAHSGEFIKVKADNLAPPAATADQEDAADNQEWLVRGANAVVLDTHEELAGQHVRVVSLDVASGQVKCVVRATSVPATIDRDKLRPVEGAARPAAAAAAEPKAQPAQAGRGSDWGKMELERRRLAEGFRSGFEEGATVELQGLKGAAELNGKRGRLVSWNSQSLRWNVEVEGVVKALNPSNLVPVAGPPAAEEQPAAEPEAEAAAEERPAAEPEAEAAADGEPDAKRQKVE